MGCCVTVSLELFINEAVGHFIHGFSLNHLVVFPVLYMLFFESCGISKCTACCVGDRRSGGDD